MTAAGAQPPSSRHNPQRGTALGREGVHLGTPEEEELDRVGMSILRCQGEGREANSPLSFLRTLVVVFVFFVFVFLCCFGEDSGRSVAVKAHGVKQISWGTL